MSDSSNIVVETASRILQDLCTADAVNGLEEGRWPAELWNTLEEAGLPTAWVPEELGGAGGELADGFGVIRMAGRHTAPVPLAETLMAGFLLARAGLPVPAGPLTVAPVRTADALELDAGGRLRGTVHNVPFARQARHVAVLARRAGQCHIALVGAEDCKVTPGDSIAGEPRDTVSFPGVTPKAIQDRPEPNGEIVALLGAAIRSAQMAGALERILDLSLQYATERVQFGRPIAKFQAIQQSLAQLAGEVAAASAAATAAADAVGLEGDWGENVVTDVAAAKIRVGEATGIGAAIAHQVHGAMGFTYEHSLHHATRRLWSWRDEFGDESHWSIQLGRIAARHGTAGLWAFITGGDATATRADRLPPGSAA